MLLILYDFNFHLPSAKNIIDSNFGYIFILHDGFILLDVFNPSTSFDSPLYLIDDDETN